MRTQAALGFVCMLLAATAVNAQAFQLAKSASCKYMDEGYIRATSDSNIFNIRFPIHTETAMDLVNYYLGTIRITDIEDAATSCAGFKLVSESNSNMYPTDIKWYRIPVMAASSSQSLDTDFDNKLTENQAFIYVALRTSAPTVATTTTPLSYAPNLKVNSFSELFQRAAFNTQDTQVGNNYGMAINSNGGAYHIILLQPYQISAAPVTKAATSTICPSGDLLYRNCALQYGPMTGPTPANGNGPVNPFFSTFKINFIVWWMVITTLCYFFWGVGADNKSLLRPDDEDNRFFNHPFYSAWTFGTELQTKLSRVTLIYLTLASMLFACSFIHYILRNESIGARVGIAIPVGLAFSWVIIHFLSIFLNRLTRSHYQYIDSMKTADTHDKRLEAENTYDNNRSTWNFLFYGLAFPIAMGCYWGAIGLTINFTNTRFWWLMLSYGIVIFGEFLILDYVIGVAIGKGEGGLAKWVKSRGYFIDYNLHKKWDDFLASQE